MPLRSYLLIMLAMTIFCWLVFGYVIATVDPLVTNAVGFSLFYLSLFLSLSGASAIIGFLIRFVFLRHELVFNTVKAAFRQSFLFSGFIVAALFLLSQNLLTWLNSAALIIGLSILEFFLLSYSQNRRKTPDQPVNHS